MMSEKIIIPGQLKPGDRIGIVAPAGPFDRETFDRGTNILQKMGFEIFVPPQLLEAKGYLAGSDQRRAQFVNQLFADKSIDAIICARGGYGSIRILPLLDYDTIGVNPKVFIGFSDITVLLNVLTNRCGLVTFHGPVVTSLADSTAETRDALLKAVSSDAKLEVALPGGTPVKAGSGTGAVCGGNLTTLCHLVGTPYAPDFTNKILFLEDRGEAPYRIDRMLVHMKLAGCFENLAGIVLGSFEDCGSMESILDIVSEIFSPYPIPILAGLNAGHGNNNVTIPLGIEATLDADRHILSYRQAATVG
ncbi:MAG: LD-carboxypeptidase [Desulfobacterales bacterium]|nr:MAG: LD-carboxypeptidase [Desulfobacterales bacterium]